ncbi:ATP-grasp domain-containing protein [Streptomyces sp. NPDC018964]|uniref:ATP-grasp domain-containing protein n=1 Tax=Streptomyces sp. NPDC018964 TaxID=3365058 RepID=UPI0037B17254
MADAGIEVSFVTANLDAYRGKPGFELSARAARLVEVSLTAEGALADRLRGRLGPVPPDGVICRDEVHLPAVVGLARDLGVPHESPAAARLLGDKAAVRARLDEHGIGSLRWRVAATEAEGLAAVDEIGLPVVVKPTVGGWSVGVSVAWSRAEAAAALARVLGAAAGDDGRPPRALVEEYAVGRHVSAELLVQGDRTVLLGFAERLPAPPGQTAELGGHFPARPEQEAAARAFVLDAVRALGIRASAVHAELLLTPTGPELIEVNGRIAGHVVTRQMSLALGRSITRDLVALAVGDPVRPAAPAESVVALHQLTSPVDAVVRAAGPVDGPDASVVEARLEVTAGDRVRALRTNHDRFGHVLARGRTAEEAARTAEEAARRALASLRLERVGPAPDGRGDDTPCGEHLMLLLGDEEPVERILEAVGAVTARVSVVWTGSADGERRARALWAGRCRGRWHRASTARQVRDAVRLTHADRPVRGLLTFSSATVARQLREDRTGARVTPAADVPPGHTVVVVTQRGDVRAVAVIDEEGGGTRLCPSELPAARRAGLAGLAVRAVRRARLRGVVRCFFPAGRAPASPPELLTGLDAATLDLYDAVHARSLVAVVAEAALGRGGRGTRTRRAVAVQRAVRTPAGPWRAVEATTADELRGRPGLFRARVSTAAGDVHRPAEPTVWLRHTVVAPDRERARRGAERLERSLVLRTTPLDRTHVLLLDRIGAATWTGEDGSPLLPADRFRLSVLSAVDVRGPADLAVRTDLTDPFALRALARAVHAAHPVHRVAALSERLLEPAARLRELLGAAGDGPERVRRFLDKAVMKRIALEHGIRCADGVLADGPGDVTALFERHGRIVLKPRAGSGSQGVVVLSGRSEVETWLREEFTPGTHLCEEFVDAPMCHIDAVVHGGETEWTVSVYTRDTMALRRGQPLSSATAADPAVREGAGRLLEQVVDAWRVRSGVLHLEAFLTGDRPTFCEVAARPGGAGVAEAFRATTGIDLDHAKILADAGEDPRAHRRDPVAAHAGWTVHYGTGGTLLEFDDSAVAPHAYVRSVRARVGQELPVSRFSGTGVSTHVFAHDSPAELGRLLERAEREVRIVTGPAAGREVRR